MSNKILGLQLLLIEKIKAFIANEEGAETMEYAVIAGVIVMIGVVAYDQGGIDTLISGMFTDVQNSVDTAVGP